MSVIPQSIAYKDSGVQWLGKIPIHWEVRRLASFGSFSKGGNISRGDLSESGNSVILYGDIYTKYEIKTSNLKSKVAKDLESLAPSICKGDILFAGSGETKEDIGKAIVYQGDEKAFAGGDIIILRQVENDSLFLSYSLNSQYAKAFKAVESKGEIIVHIYASNLRDLKIPLPPLKEQQAIADFLDKKTRQIEEFIDKKQKLITLLEEKKQTLINQCVTQGLDPSTSLKDSGVEWLGKIPTHWEVRKLKLLFGIGSGLGITKADFVPSGIPCVSYGEIHSKYPCRLDTGIHPLPYVSEDYLSSKPQALLKKGDFVFADTSEDIEGSGNFTSLQSDEPVFAGYHTIVLKPKTQSIHSPYFSFLFDSLGIRNQVRKEVCGVKVYSITKSILKEVQCLIPPLEEQKAIAEYLDTQIEKIDLAIRKIKSQINLIKEYKTTLISEAVCGRIGVGGNV